MPSDSGYISMGSKNRNSFVQWTPQHSLSLNNSSISTSMSKHLHSTTRRVFIGPTPSNWSYKKSSLWFSKSDQAIHHRGPNRQKTFRAEPEFKGPSNICSLDFCEVPDDHDPASVHITDTPLVAEPEELSNESGSSYFSNEIFYTPNEELRSFPTTPNYKQTYFSLSNSTSNQKNLTWPKLHFNVAPTMIERINESNMENVEEAHSSLSKSHDRDNNEINNVHGNDVGNGLVDDSVKYAKSVKSMLVNEHETIIKEGRMLIRIERLYHRGIPTRQSGRYLKSNASRKYLTQSAGWREYIVKLRPGIIELYGPKKSRFAKMRFNNTTRLTLFSAVDYTFSLRQKSDYGMKVFLLNPKTIEQSVEWYRVLYATLREPLVKPMPTSIEVYVPDLDVHVKISLEKCDQAYQITGEEVTKLVLDELSGEPEWDDVLCEWLKSCDLRLCWKRYDRLEWIIWEKNEEGKVRNDLFACPQFIEGTHQLQLRPTEHYPTYVHLNDGTKLYEPPPIEGYLIRVTNNKGQWKPKRLYFASHDRYLFFLKPFAASPPPPPVSLLSNSDEGNEHQVPLIYSVAPQSLEQCAQSDAYMKADTKRRIKQIVNAIAFIDLIDVVEVKIVENSDLVEMENHGCPFELVLNNGRNIMFQAYSRQTMDEWITRLNMLIKYWKARISLDVQIRINMFKVNVGNFHEDDDNASQNELHSHWNNFQSYVNPTIWHWCILNGCRGITKGGLLYNKSHLRGAFENYHHILTRGYLLYYKLYSRKLLSGTAKQRSFYKCHGRISLADCYVYSGSITEYDLLYSSSSKFSANDETHHLPRIYSDGMYCFDNEEECTFVIWQGKQTLYFGMNGKDEKDKKDRKKSISSICLKKKTILDQPGNVWVFRARSRIEREEWVWAINVEIERAHKDNEEK